MNTKRQLGPDVVRGALLTLVIFGHTFQQSVDHSHLKWMIYAFHMPLFFVLTGSLMNVEKLRHRSLLELLLYYSKRMGWQWLVATILFAMYRGVSFQNTSDVLEDFLLDPYFHLWFIPALFLMVLITWLSIKIGANHISMLVIGGLTFIVFEALQIQNSVGWLNADSIDYRFAALYVWFVLGLLIAQRPPINLWITLPMAVVGSAGMFMAFPSAGSLRDMSFFLMNAGLAGLLPHLIYTVERIGSLRWLAPVGQFSLWIYLLHPFATDLLRKNIAPNAWWQGLAMTIAIVVVSVACAKIVRFVQK